MVAFGALLLIPILCMILCALIAPLCFAFHHGLAAARDPANRVTPLDPWNVFTRAALRKLRWWWFVWAAVSIVFFWFGWSEATEIEYAPSGYKIGTFFSVGFIPAGFWLLSLAACAFWAPRIRGTWVLAGATAICSITLYAAISAVCLTGGMGTIDYKYPGGGLRVELFPAIITCLGFLACVVLRSRAKARGEEWFRFEE